jgi:hypothetical protein
MSVLNLPAHQRSSVYDEHDFNGNRDKVVDYAARGYSGVYISKATGLHVNLVYFILKDEYQKRCSSRQALIQAQDQTINWLLKKITERIHKGEDKWARQDAELLLKLMERQSKLHGLDQPLQHQVSVTVDEMSDEEVIKQLRAEGIEIKQLPPAAIVPKETPAQDAEYVEKVCNDK